TLMGEQIAVEVGAEELGVQFGRLMRLLDRTNTHSVTRRRDGVDKAAFAALFALVEGGPQRLSGLAEIMLSDPSTVSRHIAHLVDRGLVERTADPVDGRACLLVATERGRQSATDIVRRRTLNLSLLLADWPVVDRLQFTELLARFTNDFERNRPHFLAMSEAIPGSEGES
ncbi:MAG: MarR family transcriptional regulator, partial [Mycobacteriaceae bacterium]